MKITVLGSTGSIGTQTLQVVRENKDIEVLALSCGRNIELLEKQIREFKPRIACTADENGAEELRSRCRDIGTKIVSGMEGLIECAILSEVDTVVTALVGMMGIRPTIAAIEAGKNIALANKETLVTAGHIIMPLATSYKVKILPVDSEHSAIFQSLQGNVNAEIERILLTASGGPFRGYTREMLESTTVEAALKHPNWSMGKKITIDSATMVNKGLEVMEAKWLFGVEADKITVMIHPQSILHSAVEFTDGGIIGQMGTPDMKLPIQYALLYPERKYMPTKRVNFFELKHLDFEEPRNDVFEGLPLAYEAIRKGGSMPTVYNAANEKAVALFLKGKIGFLTIYDIIREAMNAHRVIDKPSVEEILETERLVYEHIEKGNY